MALFDVGVALFMLVGCVSADTRLKNCVLKQAECDELSNGLLRFFVNHVPGDGGLACEALELLVSSGCVVSGEIGVELRTTGEEYCSFGFRFGGSVDGFHSSMGAGAAYCRTSGRKILSELRESGIVGIKYRREEHWHEDDGGSSMPSKGMVIAAPVAFLFCCAFVCPCFQKKEKEVSRHHHVARLGHDLNSSEYLKHSGGAPWSPNRVPPSPLKPTASQSRFADQNTSGTVQFNMKMILKATENFSESHVIGEGGFGKVYKAEFPNGLVVAIKRARKEHLAALQAEFRNEIGFLSKIEHQSLVKLLGYIDQEQERIIISEYVSNGTLRDHLDGLHGKILDFSRRLSIAIDVAHGITYLHLYAAERPIIHRDVKSSNILLTENLRAKVADFGFARSGPTGEDQTHISTAVKGTAGYVDPEYLRTYKLTTKSDVFSFGALLIEIISGRRPVEAKRPVEERITVRWAFKNYTHGRLRDILDSNLDEEVPGEILSKLLELAFRCVASTHNDRPTMQEVQKSLWDIRKEHSSFRGGTQPPAGYASVQMD